MCECEAEKIDASASIRPIECMCAGNSKNEIIKIITIVAAAAAAHCETYGFVCNFSFLSFC